VGMTMDERLERFEQRFERFVEYVESRFQDLPSREEWSQFATKAHLAQSATKADLADLVTKADLAQFGTKGELAEFRPVRRCERTADWAGAADRGLSPAS
jgi:hypothetical protein